MAQADAQTAMLVLAAASAVVAGIQDGMAERGFGELRPAHGFAFVRIAAGDATVLDVAEHLGVTKQAASKLVDQLVEGGYVRRGIDRADARRRPLRLTARGRACTAAAEDAGRDVIRNWRSSAGAEAVAQLRAGLQALPLDGPIRPAW